MKVQVIHKESVNWKKIALDAQRAAEAMEQKAIRDGIPASEDEKMPPDPPVDEGLPPLKTPAPLATLSDAFDIVIKRQKI